MMIPDIDMDIPVQNHPELEQLLTVILSTKNRWDDLVKALNSLRRQTLAHEVIVMDDHSEDGTSEKVKEFFPEVRLYTFTESKGYIIRRNEAVKLSHTPFVLSIDDDCILEQPDILFQMASFCKRTSCEALAWPFIDVNRSPGIQSHSPDERLWQCHTFKGCAFVVKKESFIRLGGFRASFVHQGEEEDYCIRLLNAGFPVLLGNGNPILHYESPRRSWERMDFYGSRNLMLFAFFNVPLVFLPVQCIASAVKSILFGIRIRRPYQKTRGVLSGIIDGAKMAYSERSSVKMKTYMNYMSLKKKYKLVSREAVIS